MATKKTESEKSGIKIGQTEVIKVSQINDPRIAMRKTNPDENIAALAASIKKTGLINPITVKKVGKNYEVIAGHRRLQAHRYAGINTIKAIVISGQEKALELVKIHENLEREQVSLMDEAAYIQEIMKTYQLNQKEVAEMLAKSQAYVSDRLAILKYPEVLAHAVNNGEMAYSSARELMRIENEQVRNEYITHAVKNGITPEQAKMWAESANAIKDQTTDEKADDPQGGSIAPPTMPMYECAACGVAHDVRVLRAVRVCGGCDEALRTAARTASSRANG